MDTQSIWLGPAPKVAPRRVWVCRQPATEAALYDMADLRALTWTQISGGRRQVMPGCFVSAIVPCDGAIEGEVGHAGSHGGPCPHMIRVAVVASHNDNAIMTFLRNEVGPKPVRVTNADRALACIASAGPDGINQSGLYRALCWSTANSRYGEVLERLEKNGQVTVTSERRPNSLGRMGYQTIYRVANQA